MDPNAHSQQQQQSMYHGNHGAYDSTARPPTMVTGGK